MILGRTPSPPHTCWKLIEVRFSWFPPQKINPFSLINSFLSELFWPYAPLVADTNEMTILEIMKMVHIFFNYSIILIIFFFSFTDQLFLQRKHIGKYILKVLWKFAWCPALSSLVNSVRGAGTHVLWLVAGVTRAGTLGLWLAGGVTHCLRLRHNFLHTHHHNRHHHQQQHHHQHNELNAWVRVSDKIFSWTNYIWFPLLTSSISLEYS